MQTKEVNKKRQTDDIVLLLQKRKEQLLKQQDLLYLAWLEMYAQSLNENSAQRYFARVIRMAQQGKISQAMKSLREVSPILGNTTEYKNVIKALWHLR